MTADFAIPQALPLRPTPWGTLASIGLHAALLALLLLATPLRQLIPPPPAAVSVEIVTEAELETLNAPPVLAAPVPNEETAPVAPGTSSGTAPATPAPVTPAPAGMVTATNFYAAGILQEPGMERIRKAFGTLAGSEKLVQLCNIEGLEQIRRADPGTDPDTLVPYAMADMDGSGLTLIAAGGAYRSRRRWYGITFRCTVAPNFASVTAFQFKLGTAIPETQWEEHNLNVEDADE